MQTIDNARSGRGRKNQAGNGNQEGRRKWVAELGGEDIFALLDLHRTKIQTPATVYRLMDPITRKVRYVGLTTQPLCERLRSHLSEISTSEKAAWIKSLLMRGVRPVMQPIQITYDTALEHFWIEHHLRRGCDLLNRDTKTISIKEKISLDPFYL